MTGTSPAQPTRQRPPPIASAHAGDPVASLTFPGAPESAGAARKALRPLLTEHVADLDDALLLLTETITNAWQHSRGGTIDVNVILMCGRVRVEVGDPGPLNGNRPVVLDSSDGVTGRGLWIIREYAAAWGWAPRHTGNGRAGTVVWFELPRKQV